MEHINVYSGQEVISRVVVSEDLRGLETCLKPYRKIFVIMDANVFRGCPALRKFAESADGLFLVEASEARKTMETVLEIDRWLLEKGADRDALVLAAGGGITTDMAGFAASIYKRGVRFAYIPTTLLAQVDASVGGKTGVNLDGYKNILGVIRQPEFTYVCPMFLESLPQREFFSGAAELLKTFVIEDGGNYRKAADMLFDISGEYHVEVLMNQKDGREVWKAIMAKHLKGMAILIASALRVKAGVVSRDQFERDERRKLNLGHTFAHAIETLAQSDGGERFEGHDGVHDVHGVSHGEAVAMGMVLAARLADRYFRKDTGDPTELEGRISSDLWDCNIPCYCPYSVQEMADVMAKDKKAGGGKVHFVLPRAIGDVVMVGLTIDEVVKLLK